METLRQDIRHDFEYALKNYNPQKEQAGCYLSEYEVLKAHYFLSDYFLSEGEAVRFGVLNYGLLSSAVSRQYVSFGEYEKWKNPMEKLATLLFGLTKNHAFNDGNKRTALLALLIGLHKLNRHVKSKKNEFETLLVRIASNTLNAYKNYSEYKNKADAEVLFIANFIKTHTRKRDSTFHSLTYLEFNRKLKNFNVWLDNPQGNTINVYQRKKKKSLFGLHTKSQDERIYQIGFPGWKRQVNPKALKCVLQAAGLTISNGIDSKVFYEGEEPEYKLIEEYHAVLQRLKDK